MMNAQIIYRLKGGAQLTYNVREGEATLGREPGLPVAVPAEGVSRMHAKITWDGASYWIEDLKSTNGTFVNGFDVAREGKERLRHLDVITLGRGIDLLFLVREAAVGLSSRLGVVRATLTAEEADAAPYEIAMGELTLGRSAANAVIIDSSAVSKLHAKIQRTAEHLVLIDLSSSNGTFVNGARVRTAVLQDGDRVAVAGVATFRIAIETGEVSSPPEARAAVPAAGEDKPEFSADWKTRYEWDSGEYADLQALRKKIQVEDETRPRRTASSSGDQVRQPKEAAAAGASRPAAPKPAPVVSPKPAIPPPAALAPPAVAPALKPAPTAKPPASPAAVQTPAAAPMPAAPPKAAAPPRILKVHLIAPEVDLLVTDPGTYEIGRLSDAQLRIVHPTVSRRQARLMLSADRAWVRIEPLGSSPTLLNDKILNDPAPLANGDRLQLGEVVLTVRLES